MDTAYKLAMKAQIAEIAEELAEIQALEAEQGYMPTMATALPNETCSYWWKPASASPNKP